MMSKESARPRLVVYDGDCPVCCSTAERLRKREWKTAHEVVAFQDLEPDLAERMSAAGIDRQMLILDPTNNEVTGGFKAVQAIEAASGRRWFADLIKIPGVAHLGALGYHLFAVNRRLLSPVPPGLVCTCDPRPRRWEQAAIWILLGLPLAGLVLQAESQSRTVLVAFCLMWMVPLLAGLLVAPGPTLITSQLAVSLSLAALVGLAAWALMGLWTLIDPSGQPYRLLITLSAMWLVGGVMLWRRFRTLGVPRLFWLWQAPMVLVLLILLISPRPVG